MKILVLGDVHGKIDKVKGIINSVECDSVIQTGDLGTYSDIPKPMYFIAGNHEDWKIINNMDNGRSNFKDLYHVKTAKIIRLVKNNDTLSLSGINGNYSPKDYELKKQTLQGNRRSHFVKDDVEKCKKLRNLDVFLSHEPPADIGFIKRSRDVGIRPIKEILDSVNPRFFFFCHHHMFFEKIVGGTRIFGLDYAWREYYILDSDKDEFERILLDDSDTNFRR